MPRKGDDLLRREAADRRRPHRVLRLSVAAAQEIILERFVADAEPIEEGTVVPPLAYQSVSDTEHQRDIGAGADRVPDRTNFRRQIVAQRADQVEFDPPIAGGPQLLARDVPAGAAAADIVVFQRHAAKGQHQGALCDQLGPADIVACHRPLRADDMRQDHRRSTRAVAADRADIATRKVEKTMDLALRIVEASGTRPAVGPAENRPGAMGRVDPPQFRRDEVERPGPRDRHELVAAPPVIGSRAAFQPAASNHRSGDPRRV